MSIKGFFTSGPLEPPREFIIFDTSDMNETCRTIGDFIAGCYYKSSGGSNMGQNGTPNFGGTYRDTFFPMFGIDDESHIIKMSDLIKGDRLTMIKLFAQYCNDPTTGINLDFEQTNSEFAKSLDKNFATYYNMKDMFEELYTILTSYYFNGCQVITSIILAELFGIGFWVNNEGGRNFARFMKQSPIYEQLSLLIEIKLSERRVIEPIITTYKMVKLLISVNAQYTEQPIDSYTSLDKVKIPVIGDDKNIILNSNTLIPRTKTTLRKHSTLAIYNPDSLLELLQVNTVKEVQTILRLNDEDFLTLLKNSHYPSIQAVGLHLEQQKRLSTRTQMGRGIRHRKSKRRKSTPKKLKNKKQKTKNKK